jgi:two-component system response regulator GlrR
MSRPVLVVEADSMPTDASVHALLASDPGFECRRLPWDAMTREDLTRQARGLVAVAVPHTPTTAARFERLRGYAIGVPTFAVLPSDVEEPVLRVVSDCVDDFMLFPIRATELRYRLRRMLGPATSERDAVRERLLEEMAMTQLVGQDPVFLEAIAQVPRFARSGMPVLISGETGTGKELCARAIHFLGKRRDRPFIAVDCGALPDHLLENELFGHSRGAYTDAHRDQRGLIVMAEGGVLFLDEIDALSPTSQSKLLRFLQERTYRPLGAERFESADINVIAATNRDLEAMVARKQFRADLFYRLNVLRLHLPALRDRVGDIGILASHFLGETCASGALPERTLSSSALRMLAEHDWPGNIRELANVVQRAAVLCDGARVLPCHLVLPQSSAKPAEAPNPFRKARALALAAFERRYVEGLLEKYGGNVTRAAREAEKDRRVFGRLMKKHGIQRHRRP